MSWKQKQLARQRNRCHYCDCMLDGKRYFPGERLPENAATIDHVVPRARGGTNNPNNLVLACLKCNQDKRDHIPSALKESGMLVS